MCVLVASLALATTSRAQTPTPTFGGDCCSARGGDPGCEDPTCTTCVCNVDELCCFVGWDEFCVGIAMRSLGCADACPCATPTPTPPATPTPGGDCCAAHNGPGCDDAECQECVCNDVVCCTEVWDSACVEKAIDDCATECDCAGLTPTPTPEPTATPGGNCCEPHSGPSCDDPGCRDCVCSQDAVCCDATWDGFCVDRAAVECAADCSCQPKEDCCEVHASVGCDEARCQACVCATDAFCCSTEPKAAGAWDPDCVAIAATECALDCTCDAGAECCSAHEGVGCNVLSCQDCVCKRDDFCCSLDPQAPGFWDQDCADLASNPDECGAACPCGAADCCQPHDGAGCDQPECESCVCAIDAPCCSAAVWDERCVEGAMTDCDSRCACEVGGEGDCCAPHESPGCELSACEQCVCDEDGFCCDSSIGEWDRGCVDLASRPDLCATACACEPLSDCCFERDEPGCDQPTCEECVCGLDEFCCDATSGFWDERCAETAQDPTECGSSCACIPFDTPTASPTPSATPTATDTPVEAFSPTVAATPTATATPISTPTGTDTASVTHTPTGTATRTATATSTFAATASHTETPSVTPSIAITPTFTRVPVPCTGDCDNNEEVITSEVVTLVRIALGAGTLGQCPGFDAASGGVAISDLVSAVHMLLHGCRPT